MTTVESQGEAWKYSRRAFLGKAAGVGLSLAVGGALLDACSSSSSPASAPAASRGSSPGTSAASAASSPASPAAVASSGAPTSSKALGPVKYHWRTGTVVAATDPFYTYLTNMSSLIQNKTNGSVKIDVFPAGQLGAEADTFKLLQSGAIQFQATSSVTINATVPETVLYSLPYVLDPSDPAKMRAVYTGSSADLQKQKLAALGVQTLNFVNNGTRHFGGKEFFDSPTDMKNVKIRVPGTPLYEGIFKAFGAVPTPLALTDTYNALQQGLVTAYEQPLPGIQAEKWYEIANKVTLSAYTTTPVFVAVNKGIWTSLPSAIQDGITAAVEEASAAFDNEQPAHSATAQAALAALGVTFSTPDLDAYKALSKSVYNDWASKVGGIDLINQVINGG